MTDEDLQKIYVWVDSIPLSRPKRNISRDFSDGVLLAEIVHHYFPKLVELHNYSAANSVRQKLYNWSTLNQRALRRLDFEIKRPEIEALVACKPGIVEAVLMQLQRKIAEFKQRRAAQESGSEEPSSPQASVSAAGAGHASSGARVAAEASPSAAPALPGFRPADNGNQSAALAEKDATIGELRETVEILELKIKKLEQLVRLKDSRIQTLTSRLQGQGGAAGLA